MKRLLCGLAVLIAAAVLAPGAAASVTPSLKLDQSAGTTAGSTANLGMDIKFAPSGTVSPKHLTLVLPPGLLANAAIDGGGCLTAPTPTTACQVGTGTVSASSTALGTPVPLPGVSVAFDLVAPPSQGDLAGLAIVSTDPLIDGGGEIGTPGDVTVRPGSDPAGVGLNIAFTNLPESASLPVLGPTNIAVDEIQSTFDGLRLPASCPATPANVSAVADSYQDSSAQRASDGLQVTGCPSLPYAPAFHVTAAKDAADRGVAIQTDITQAPTEATSRTAALNLPSTVLMPNAAGVLSGGVLCSDPSFATCKTVGSATATSPLYPSPLTGRAYLDGPLATPSIALVFPPPFGLTLVGNVNLPANSTTFNNVPDIPLSDLKVNLAGGPNAVFATTCSPASGTATATLTSQNGDKTASPASSFTVSGCSGSATGTGGGKAAKKGPKSARPKLSAGSASGLTKGKPTVKFTVGVARTAAKLVAISIKLPNGLSFNRRRVHKGSVTGLILNGNGVKSAALKRGALVVAIKRPVWSLTVRMGSKLLKESKALKHKAQARRHRLSSLKVSAGTDDANGETFAPSLVIRKLNLPKLKAKPKHHGKK
jgi:hypothetical protein